MQERTRMGISRFFEEPGEWVPLLFRTKGHEGKLSANRESVDSQGVAPDEERVVDAEGRFTIFQEKCVMEMQDEP